MLNYSQDGDDMTDIDGTDNDEWVNVSAAFNLGFEMVFVNTLQKYWTKHTKFGIHPSIDINMSVKLAA